MMDLADAVCRQFLKRHIEEAMECLNEREHRVLYLRYGLGDGLSVSASSMDGQSKATWAKSYVKGFSLSHFTIHSCKHTMRGVGYVFKE